MAGWVRTRERRFLSGSLVKASEGSIELKIHFVFVTDIVFHWPRVGEHGRVRRVPVYWPEVGDVLRS